MFKSLLRTLPSLTGNVTLACKITDIDKENNNIYNGYCREAELKPLQDNLYNKYVSVNLLSGLYEYDISKFYKYYKDVFYKTNFDFNINDFKLYDSYKENYDRNINYEFGCKRISYNVNKYMLEFFAPIYIDTIDDIPDYFEISLQINKSLIKKLRIHIGLESKKNFLYHYLNRYVSNIDNYVIFYNDNLKSFIYHAINVNNGGFVKIQDNSINYIMTNQTTVHLFDKSLNKGFENNKLVIKQIIPLSFLFNIDNVLNEDEKLVYKFIEIQKISGHYIKNNKTETLYDFDMDYKQIHYQNLCYENQVDLYKYENKISPIYNKWKLQLSKDVIYNTNLNMYYSDVINGSNQYNVLINYNNSLTVKENNVNVNRYNSNGFDIINILTLNDSIKFFNTSNWNECINNYAYVNNFIYDLNILTYKFNFPKIDYFNVFILPIENTIENPQLVKTIVNFNSTIKNNAFNYNSLIDSNENLVKLRSQQSEYDAYIENDIYFIKSQKYDKSKKQYIHLKDNKNRYVKLNDIQNILNDNNINVDDFIIEGYIYIPNIKYQQNIESIYSLIYNQLYYVNDFVDKITKCTNSNYNILNSKETKFYIKDKFIDYNELYNLLQNYDIDLVEIESNLNLYQYQFNTFDDNIFSKIIKTHYPIYFDTNYSSDNEGLILIDNIDLYTLYKKINDDNWYDVSLSIDKLSNYNSINEELIKTNINLIDSDIIYNDNTYNLHKKINISRLSINELKNILNDKYTYYVYIPYDIDQYNHGKDTYVELDNSFNDYLLLKQIFVDCYRTPDEINRQHNLFDNHICFYNNITNEYIKITDESISQYEYDENIEIVYVDNLYLNYNTMVEYTTNVHEYMILNLINKELINLNDIDKFNKLIEIYSNSSIILENIVSNSFYNVINGQYMININKLLSYISSLVDQLNTLNIFDNTFIDTNINNFLLNTNNENYIDIKTFVTTDINEIYSLLDNIQTQLYDNIKQHIKLNDNITLLDLPYNDDNICQNTIDYFDIELYEYFKSNNTNIIDDSLLSQLSVNQYIINNELPIKLFEYNDKIYCSLLLTQLFTNTNLTYNLKNYTSFNYINDNLINGSIITNIYYIKLLMPYLKFNLFKNIVNILNDYQIKDIVVYPKKYTIKTKYDFVEKTKIINNYIDSVFENTNYKNSIYSIEQTNNSHIMNLYRYMNYIMPIFKSIQNSLDIYCCKFKYSDAIEFNSDNIYNKNININKYSGIISFYDNTQSKLSNINDSNIKYDIEYKHFNDNKIINTVPNFEVTVNKELTYKELLKYEQKDIILEYFIKYIKQYSKNIVNDEKHILFLFNKYKISCNSTPIMLNYLKTYKLYSLKYIFNLL